MKITKSQKRAKLLRHIEILYSRCMCWVTLRDTLQQTIRIQSDHDASSMLVTCTLKIDECGQGVLKARAKLEDLSR